MPRLLHSKAGYSWITHFLLFFDSWSGLYLISCYSHPSLSYPNYSNSSNIFKFCVFYHTIYLETDTALFLLEKKNTKTLTPHMRKMKVKGDCAAIIFNPVSCLFIRLCLNNCVRQLALNEWLLTKDMNDAEKSPFGPWSFSYPHHGLLFSLKIYLINPVVFQYIPP